MKHEPYPVNRFSRSVIDEICKRVVHLKTVGHADMTGDEFTRIFADSIDGTSFGKPVGIADVAWNGCGWSVKTVKHRYPLRQTRVRLISGRNSPVYSSGITNPFADLQATGESVLKIYNARIHAANWDHSDMRMLVLVRNMASQEFLMYERPISPYLTNSYRWEKNKQGNLQGYDGDRHAFTWQPHGSQFTIIDPVPAGAARFRIGREPAKITLEQAVELSRFKSDWVEIL